MNSNLDNFMKELTELSKKYGYAISGCGCCGSPNVDYTKDNNEVFTEESLSDIEWNSDEQIYKGEFYIWKTKEKFVYKTSKDE